MPDNMPVRQEAPPKSITVALLSNLTADEITDEVLEACESNELIISLGNVDLATLAVRLGYDGSSDKNGPLSKAAVCVLGGQDRPVKPAFPFRGLQCNSLPYKGWKITGLSGTTDASKASTNGMHISESEASNLVHSNMPSADILISHMPPAELPGYNSYTDPGLRALSEYIDAALPAYCFYAIDAKGAVEMYEWADEQYGTILVGVNGLHVPPPLQFF